MVSERKLIEVIANYRTDRPDEWTMDTFIRVAEKIEAEHADNLQDKLDRILEIRSKDESQ